MPYRRSYNNRRRSTGGYRRRPRATRYAKRYYGRKAMRKSNYKKSRVQATYATLRTVVDVTTGANGDFTLLVNFNGEISTATAGTAVVNSYSDTTGTAYALQDAPAYAALYEQKRCRGVRIRFIPSSPDDSSSTTSYQPLYMIFDKDGNEDIDQTSTVNDILEENRFTIRQLYRPLDVYKRAFAYKLQSKFPIATSSSIPSTQLPAGYWTHTSSSGGVSTSYPHWIWAIRDGTASKNYGKLVIDFYLTFKDRA